MPEYVQKPGWPSRSCDLLLRAALGSPDMAQESWAQWLAEYDLDKASWSEVRLLASVAKRFGDERIQGIQRFIWVQTQMQLTAAVDGLQLLHQHMPVLLLKGAARIAADPSVAKERLVRDVDVLVPRHLAEKAFQILFQNGWQLSGGPDGWQARGFARNPLSNHGWAFENGRSGELDVHHCSNYVNREEAADDTLWSRAREVSWHGTMVRVPSAEDALLISIVHGVRWSAEGAADWVLDAWAALQGDFSWEVFEAEVRRRRVSYLTHAGLGYLRERLHVEVPALPDLSSAEAEKLRVYSTCDVTEHWKCVTVYSWQS